MNMGVDSDRAAVASILTNQFNVRGAIASNGNFLKMAMLNQYMGTKYFGTLEDLSGSQALPQLKSHNIQYFFVWHSEKKQPDWDIIGVEVANKRIPNLAVYRVK